MPLYLNRQTRVCTVSRPYYIAESSARKHEIPISSIPCMAYQRRKETVEKQIKEHNQSKLNAAQTKCPFAATNQAEQTIESNPTEAKDLKGKKVTVSIQTNEEKSKENLLCKLI